MKHLEVFLNWGLPLGRDCERKVVIASERSWLRANRRKRSGNEERRAFGDRVEPGPTVAPLGDLWPPWLRGSPFSWRGQAAGRLAFTEEDLYFCGEPMMSAYSPI